MTMLLSIIAVIAFILVVITFIFLQHPKFGARSTGERLQKVRASPNYKNGSFVNHSYTPSLTKGHSMSKVMFDFLFQKGPNTKPIGTIPSIKNDLKNLSGDWLVWFGHSSYFIQTDTTKFLVDPVFSGNASPIPNSTKSFKGTDIYSVNDMPEIDYLLITHDHYDHFDYDTIRKLNGKVQKVICGLGVGAHLERWGYSSENITELDWNSSIELPEEIKIFGLTARHFSGRTFKRDQTLWMSYLLQTPTRKIYIGGDSGFDNFFKDIGELHGPIDLAIIENGQYNEAWKAIHFLPGENLQVAIDLKAKRMMPVHSSKFDIALHDWDEPLNELVRLNQNTGLALVTPMIGELVNLNDSEQLFTEWWKEVDKKVHK